MRNQKKSFVGLLTAVVFILAAAFIAAAQNNVVPSRITQAIDATRLTILRGNTHPLAQARFDRGAAPSSLPMQRMLLVLKRSAQQENALDALLEQQQDASSPNYHHWLTPQQFGQQFGPSDQDIQTITSWLQSQGFQVNRVSNGRTVIEFSGTAGEVQSAFHTAIHQYLVNGQNHWANSSDPEIPTALTPVVAGIDTLYNFPRQAFYETFGAFSRNRQTGQIEPAQPLFTLTGQQCGIPPYCYGVGPYDFATIYNVLPLWNLSPTPTDGTGVTIAIVGESDINIQDVRDFRNYFGLPANDPTIIVNGVDPGIVPGDETESDLDVEWSGAVAKGASIDFVTSQSTEASLGVDLSAEYIVDNNVAPILSESYGICELFLGNAGNQFYNQLWQQAAAQGISVLVSTGDSGSAVCDRNAGTQGAAQYGLSVNGFSSTPYNIAVGGTDFNDLTNASTYWGANSPPPGQPTAPATVSAKSYIPETTWNNSCTNAVFGNLLGYSTNAETNCNDPTLQSYGFVVAVGASGGKSNCISGDGQNPLNCTAGYAKPAWQTALTPNDGARDLPDVSLYAAAGSPSGAFYVMCEADQIQGGTSCQASDPNTYFLGVGGTSASTPAFAGIMALVNQATGSRQGNANFDLYAMAAKSGASCNSSNGAGTNCQFYDTTNGTIEMPCVKGSPNCNVSNQNDSVGILSGYNTSSGYDLATGLGSVNAANLVNAWKSFALVLQGSATTLNLTPPNNGSLTNLTHGQAVGFTTNVSAVAPATGTPSGTVALIANTGANGQGVQSVTLDSNGNGSGSTNALPGGTYTVTASYPGDDTFKSSVSPGTSVTVNPEASKVQLAYKTFNPNTGAITDPNATTAVFGTPSLLRVNVTSASGDACPNNAAGDSGCPTGTVNLTDSYNGGAATTLDAGSYALNSQGYAEDQAIDLPGGTHVLAAGYSGDSSYSAPTPNPTPETLTINPAQASLGSSADNTVPTAGANVTLFANLSASGVFSSHGPNGNVTFFANSTQIGSPVPMSGTASATTGQAFASTQTTWTATGHGSTKITATYSGDPSYSALSSYFYVNVLYASSTTVGSPSPASIQYGQSVTLNAQVSSSQGGGTPFSGYVVFLSNGVSVGSANVSAAGAASLSTANLQGGTDTITAQYNGDSNYASSVSSNNTTVTVTPDSTTTALTASSNTITQGQSVTLTATITPSPSGPSLPTGNVEFLVNGSNFGTAYAANGQAQLPTSTLPAGSDQITATYAGDSNYSGSTSPSITVTVNGPPTFSMTANPTTIQVSSPGQSGSTTLTFTGENGFSSNGSAALSPTCTNLPSESSCSISPPSITIGTNGTATATLSIMTTAPSALIPGARDRWNIGGWSGVSGEAVVSLTFIFLLCCGIALGFRGRQRRWALGFALVALGFVFANVGCGGGGGGGVKNPGTPVGSSAITVSVTINGVTQSVPLTVNVQ